MDGFKDTTRTQYYTLTPAERDMSRETSRIVPQRAQENKMQGAKRGVVVNTKPATTPATRDGARRMSDLDRRTMEEPSAPYKKGGKVKGPVVERAKTVAVRTKDTPTMNAQEMRTMQRYKAAMASRPNREPLVSPDIAAIKGALQSATRGAAPPVAARPPMMGAPAMKKGGKVLKKEDGGAIVADAESDATAREQAEGAMAQPATAPPAEAPTFGSAFRLARAAGAKAFTWRGKRYTTDLAAATRSKAAAPVRDQVSPAANSVPQKLHNTAYSVRAGMEKELADAVGTPLRVVPRLTKYGVGDAATRGELAAVKAALGLAKGGKVMKKEDGGMASSIRSAKDYNAADKDFVSARSEQLGKVIGKAEGGKADLKQDKAMLAAAIHKHERNDHPGKPLTKLRKGGMAC